MTLSWSEWWPGQPDPSSAGYQDCLKLFSGWSFKLDEFPCTETCCMGALCEISAPQVSLQGILVREQSHREESQDAQLEQGHGAVIYFKIHLSSIINSNRKYTHALCFLICFLRNTKHPTGHYLYFSRTVVLQKSYYPCCTIRKTNLKLT